MYPVPALFTNYITSAERWIESQVTIDGITYDKNAIVSWTIKGTMTEEDKLTVGAVIPRELILTLKTDNTIPKNAAILVEIRATGSSGATTWVKMGTFLIDKRSQKRDTYTFTAYDRLKLAAQVYESSLVYPVAMNQVTNEIATLIGTVLYDPTGILTNSTCIVPYEDTDITIREVLSYIASMHMGFFRITNDDKLQLVSFLDEISSMDISRDMYSSSPEIGRVKQFTKFRCIINSAGEYIEAGEGTEDETLEFTNLFYEDSGPNSNILNQAALAFGTLSYSPLVLNWKGNPSLELGDKINVATPDGLGTVQTVVMRLNFTYNGALKSLVEAVGDSEEPSEFALQGSLKDRLKNTIQYDKPYFGVSHSREYGLQVEKSDGKSKVILNSDYLKWQVEQLGSMVDRLYFDAVAGDLKYNGLFGVDAINALKAEIDVLITNTTIINNLYTEYGRIANLSVSELDTSWKKITNYLASNTDDVNYIRIYEENIKLITASTDGTEREQVQDYSGNNLYWLDETYTGMTKDDTGLPVYVYKYTELIKGELSFKLVDGTYNPRFILGAGVDDAEPPDWGKGCVYKDTDGLQLKYITSAGKELTA